MCGSSICIIILSTQYVSGLLCITLTYCFFNERTKAIITAAQYFKLIKLLKLTQQGYLWLLGKYDNYQEGKAKEMKSN